MVITLNHPGILFFCMQHDLDQEHHDELQGEHQHAAIDISPDNLNNKTNIFNPLLLIILCSGLFLIMPRLAYTVRRRSYQTRLTPCYYLHQPPLRSPPVK